LLARVSVAVSARVTLQDRPLKEGQMLPQRPLAQGPQLVEGLGINFGLFDPKRMAGFAGTGQTAMLPEVTQPGWVPAKKGGQPSSGMIIEPAPAATHLEVVSWNTGNRIGRKIGPREYDSKVTHCRASIHRMAMGYTPIVAAESIEY
jgi:hypothetical protein